MGWQDEIPGYWDGESNAQIQSRSEEREKDKLRDKIAKLEATHLKDLQDLATAKNTIMELIPVLQASTALHNVMVKDHSIGNDCPELAIFSAVMIAFAYRED